MATSVHGALPLPMDGYKKGGRCEFTRVKRLTWKGSINGITKSFDLELARLLDHPEISPTKECCNKR